MKAVLVATIGTRDLMFQVSSRLWYNIGDDRMKDGDIIGEQAEVISDLNLATITYRDLTNYLLQQIETYCDRIKPVIIGKLLTEKAADIEKVYLIKAGLSWNQGEFETFFALAQKSLTLQQKQQTEFFWWQAYEEAYLAVIRLKQNNTTEAMFHSFRAVEGLLSEWASATSEEVIAKPDQFARLKHSIGQKYRILEELFKHNGQRLDEIELNLWVMQRLLEAHIPELRKNPDFTILWRNAKIQRNNLFHRIGGLTQKQVLQAWGDDINNPSKWETRILTCLNLVTENRFQSLTQASLFASTHHRVKQAIATYQPEPMG